MKCPFCGTANEDGALFCTICGKELPQPEKKKEQEKTPENLTSNNSDKKQSAPIANQQKLTGQGFIPQNIPANTVPAQPAQKYTPQKTAENPLKRIEHWLTDVHNPRENLPVDRYSPRPIKAREAIVMAIAMLMCIMLAVTVFDIVKYVVSDTPDDYSDSEVVIYDDSDNR